MGNAKRRSSNAAEHPLSQDQALEQASHQIIARLLRAEADPRRLATGLLDCRCAELLTDIGLLKQPMPDPDDGRNPRFREYVRRVQARLRPLAEADDVAIHPFDDHLAHVATMLGLTPVEHRVLRLGALMRLYSPLRDLFDNGRPQHSDWERQRQLRALLGLDSGGLARLFSRQSRLFQLGLIEYADLDLNVCDQLARALCAESFDPMRLLEHKVRPAGPGHLACADYAHLADLPRVLRHLGKSLTDNRIGVNVLIYGPPGTGKTELVKLIAAELDARLWEVPCADIDGDMRDGNRRANTYALVQRLLQPGGSNLVMFDEVEDLFGSGGPLFDLFGGGHGRVQQNGKGWINEQLEHNPVPTFWLSNDIRAIDPAHIRRFDEVIELRAPGRSVRQRIAANYLPDDLVSPACRDRIAAIEGLPPAQIKRVGRVLAAMNDDSPAERDQAALRLLENSLRAMRVADKLPAPVLPAHYDPAVLNADADLAQLVDLLCDGQGGRLLLYGPPGTGKTAFAHYLGQRLDRPVLVRRLSDLLDMFVGGTERNIADAFRDANGEGAILLIDEADSLLRDREGARQSWEVTQVNEMLTQMEHFDGLFIASTNLVGNLDAASLRRFDFKLRFDYLRREQRLAMFEQLCRDLRVDSEGDGVGDGVGGTECQSAAMGQGNLDRIAKLDRLTPGDFATVRRQLGRGHRFVAVATVIERLAAEVAIKPGAEQRAIGFCPT